MTENDVHKCLIAYRFFPMTLILKDLEKDNQFEKCKIILDAMVSYIQRFKVVEDDIPTQWSKEFEEEYYSYFKKIDSNGVLLAKGNIDYYLSDIKKRLFL